MPVHSVRKMSEKVHNGRVKTRIFSVLLVFWKANVGFSINEIENLSEPVIELSDCRSGASALAACTTATCIRNGQENERTPPPVSLEYEGFLAYIEYINILNIKI